MVDPEIRRFLYDFGQAHRQLALPFLCPSDPDVAGDTRHAHFPLCLLSMTSCTLFGADSGQASASALGDPSRDPIQPARKPIGMLTDGRCANRSKNSHRKPAIAGLRARWDNRLGAKQETSAEKPAMLESRVTEPLLLAGCCVLAVLQPVSATAADASHGKTIAERWCAACHRVERDPKSATNQPPSFASIAGLPDFDANKLAFFLLRPHPTMPSLSLSRAEISDLADYIKTLK
jgi:mono/diheme cytochrome c family protein